MILQKTKTLIAVLRAGMMSALGAYDVPGFTPDPIIPYKQTPKSNGEPVTLNLHIFTPPEHQPTDQRPAIVFFFGGGWVSGSPTQFHPHGEYLASRGMVAISAEYRVRNFHGTTPQECVKDGKSASRNTRSLHPNDCSPRQFPRPFHPLHRWRILRPIAKSPQSRAVRI